MKKLLIATTALVATAGVAAAEVTLGGSGRFGVVYVDDGSDSDTSLSYRMRINIDGSTETDSGIKFGGRIRLQYDAGDSVDDPYYYGKGAAELNAAQLYVESAGFRVELGNANTAFDSMGTLYNAELGFIGTTLGSYALFSYDGYNSGPYSSPDRDRIGIFASYNVGDLSAKISYIDHDQFDDGDDDEVSVSFDYVTGQLSLGAGFASNAGGDGDLDVWALTGEYAINDTTKVGVQLIGEEGDFSGFDCTPLPCVPDPDDDTTFTIYGHTQLAGGIGLGAYISGLDADQDRENDIAVGIGASYDLGGATLAGTIQKGFSDETYADLGVSFSF